ncbi:hypothetical protein M622_18815 [Thauera terpenica 58Eu]|uniref:DUF1329 domain-containing protein n=1 Tax=Thauera terpenica 58Eu TaxID=1348657 RepID=S9ZIC7_9RHOO|nr:DUF1329 domain-containing protein [Thauera terpenica]EPZ14351.1 hypothetical protein M622_18815 [Thauera terpenica 58Eu]
MRDPLAHAGLRLAAALFLCGPVVASPAAPPAALTPSGAERAGTADGRIPAWSGGIARPPPGWEPSQGHTDPFAGETPLAMIERANMDEHAAHLSPGLQALLRQRKGFRMPLYPSHRTFAVPGHVHAATEAGAGRAAVEDKRLRGHRQPGIPFPQPRSGEEAMFNHLQRWIGGVSACSDWLPIRASGDYFRVGWCSKIVQASEMDALETAQDGTYFLGRYDAPTALLGTIYLVHEPLDSAAGERRAWIYNSGQRRVRRAPDLAFDNVADGSEGMATIDDGGGFNGSLERYDWKLVGKRELYVPYNAYRLASPALRYDEMIEGNLIRPELMRYELHRVWVVEATLAPGMSHIYARRTFYLDEDSWQVVIAEAWDGHGELWRVSLLPLIQLYDVPNMVPRAQMIHDLRSGSLLVTGLDNERPRPAMQWHQKGRLAEFRPAALRAMH